MVPQYVNIDAFRTLRDDWGANAVRLATNMRLSTERLLY